MPQTAVIAGVGPGLGSALARKFGREGCRVGLIARSDYVVRLERELRDEGCEALAAQADITDPRQVAEAFTRLRARLGPVDLLVNHAGHAAWKGVQELAPADFEQAWRVNAYGPFLCTRAVLPDMLSRGEGSIIFTGATSSVRGRANAVDFSSAKFAMRGLADALARELWPKGIHVAHVVLDGVIDTAAVRATVRPAGDEPLMDPDGIAQSYWALVQQDRSAWTLELDLRPFQEEFFV